MRKEKLYWNQKQSQKQELYRYEIGKDENFLQKYPELLNR